jgi:hypothetical protein
MMWYAGRAMAQAVSRRPLIAEARVRARVNPCGICGGQSGTGTGFSTSSSVSPVKASQALRPFMIYCASQLTSNTPDSSNNDLWLHQRHLAVKPEFGEKCP